jgi:DNA-binding protein Fis
MTIADLGFPTPEVLIIDHDSKYTKDFDAVWSAEGTRVKRVGPFAPNLNAFAERFAQTLRHECLDHFLILGEKHLRHLLKEFLEHYHDERPHQSLGNRPPNRPAGHEEEAVIPFVKESRSSKVVCRERLGGLLKSYSRIAAGTTDLHDEAVKRMESVLLVQVLKHTGGNQVQAAKILGIARGNLRLKIQNLGITIQRDVLP